MNQRITRMPARLAAVISIVLLLSACATTTPAAHPAVERSQARWQALVDDDLETAYTYYSPGYRSANSLIDFGVEMRTKRVRWTSMKYLEHSCDENRCTVTVDLGFQVINAVPGMSVFNGSQVVHDTWIQSQKQWWYLPEN